METQDCGPARGKMGRIRPPLTDELSTFVSSSKYRCVKDDSRERWNCARTTGPAAFARGGENLFPPLQSRGTFFFWVITLHFYYCDFKFTRVVIMQRVVDFSLVTSSRQVDAMTQIYILH